MASKLDRVTTVGTLPPDVPHLTVSLVHGFYRFPSGEANCLWLALLRECEDPSNLMFQKMGITMCFPRCRGSYTPCYVEVRAN
jgi:hypothetical protein